MNLLVLVFAVAGSATVTMAQEPESPEAAPPEAAPPEAAAPRHFEQFSSRWFAPGRPVATVEPPPYEINWKARPLNPYLQNAAKGDFPILGTEDLFLNMTLTDRLIVESRNVPTGTGITGGSTVRPQFFGDGDQLAVSNDLAFTFDLFKGQQAFKPVDWRLKITPVANINYLSVGEVGVVNINVADGDDRTKTDLALQEAFVEYHLFDLSDRYDFMSVEAGILPFRSDFRGFLFEDSNLGVRLFGNADQNKWQYNLAYFDLLDKDTNSLLNRFESRDQQVLIANVYRQDWPVLGFTTSLSFHYNHDEREVEFDDNGILVAPAPIGRAQPNEVESYYFGWTGEGHFGKWNVTHAFYQAFGEEKNNPLAARSVDINAQLAALEVSIDIDWWRPRLFGLYASGDDDTRDGDANGFDAIVDAPNFAGGELSFFNRQALRLLGTNLTNPGSPLPDLQTNKFQGQSNFVNPGLLLIGGAIDFELTPKWRAQIGGSYLRFAETEVLEVYQQLPEVDPSIGIEVFTGTQYRPMLNNNFIIQVGANALFPDDGLTRIYESDDTLYSVFTTALITW